MSQVKPQLRPTPKQVPGPYYLSNAPKGTDFVLAGVSGTTIQVSGQVLNTAGQPIAQASFDVWVAGPDGKYDNQDAQGNVIPINVSAMTLRRKQSTDAAGAFTFKCLRPGNYALDPQKTTWRPAHIHVRIAAKGYKTLVTQLYFQDDPYNEKDLEGDDFFQPELVVHMAPALAQPGKTQVGVFNFVLERQ